MMAAWTGFVLRRRIVILVVWLGLAAAGAVASTMLSPLLSDSVSVPGSGSDIAASILSKHFGENPNGTFTVVVPLNRARAGSPTDLARRLRKAVSVIPSAKLVNQRSGAGIYYAEIVTSYDLQTAAQLTAKLRASLDRSGLRGGGVTGLPAVQHDILPLLSGDLRRGQLLGIPILILVLLLVLGARPIVVVSAVVATAGIYTMLLAVFLLGHAILIVSYVPNLVELLGLGIAADYSLLMVRRFQEEARHRDRTGALAVTMATAGRTVLVSGTLVASALAAVLLIPVPFMQSLAITGILVPSVSVLAALTLLPALLDLMPLSLAAPTQPPSEPTGSRFWVQTSRIISANPVPMVACGAAILMVAAIPVLWLSTTAGSTSELPPALPATKAAQLLSNHVGPGPLAPIEIVEDAGQGHTSLTPAISAATLRLAGTILGDPAAFVAAIGSRAPYIGAPARYRRMFVISRADFGAASTGNLVNRIRSVLIHRARFPGSVRVWVGGPPAEGVDFLDRLAGSLPLVILTISLVMVVVMAAAFQSLILPLVALALDGLSALAAIGLIVLIFQNGLGAGIGLFHPSRIEAWVPVFMLAVLFGLSMDYQVFLVSRIREARSLGSREPVAEGMEQSGAIISGAAVIMVGALLGFITGGVAGLQEFGVGLTLAVLLDAFVVRLMLLPGLMILLGHRIWLTEKKAPPLGMRDGA